MDYYKDFSHELQANGYKCVEYYSKPNSNIGVAYYDDGSTIIKITYEFVKVGHDAYMAGQIYYTEDVTECYR